MVEKINITGDWSVHLENQDGQPHLQESKIRLPGSLAENGLGYSVDLKTPWVGFTGGGGWDTDPRYKPYRKKENFKVPFWLQPDAYYRGKAWFSKVIVIPDDWNDQEIRVTLERCHWKTTLLIDGKIIGSRDSLCVPHVYDINSTIGSGEHTLTICVDNNYHVRVGEDAHSVTDHTQTNWNGVIGKMSIEALNTYRIDSLRVKPEYDNQQIKLSGKIISRNSSFSPEVSLVFGLKLKGRVVDFEVSCYSLDLLSNHQAEWHGQLKLCEKIILWDEFDPNCYELTVRLLVSKDHLMDETIRPFGFRKIEAKGRQLYINDRPAMMRGTLECAVHPHTGYPPMLEEGWMKIFKTIKEHGLNHVRFHSWCPPEAAFQVADELGLYLQIEGPVWRANCSYPKAQALEPFLLEESYRIINTYGHHPSFVFFCHGNEPVNLCHDWLNEVWLPEMSKVATHQLLCAGAHFPLAKNNDFHLPGASEGVWYRDHHQYKNRPGTFRNYDDIIEAKSVPCIAHETGQWCVLPNLEEEKKYKGCLSAYSYQIMRDFMTENHIVDQAKELHLASGAFQAMIYKECNESYLRSHECGGFQLLGLSDFPGQGTAPVGILDAFWDKKDYISAEEFRRFTGPIVPLALMKKRTWQSHETFQAEIKVSQFSAQNLKDVTVRWQISSEDGEHFSGAFSNQNIPIGNETVIGNISVKLGGFNKAIKATLTIDLLGVDAQNDWDIWIFPFMESPPSIKVFCDVKDALESLEQGQDVLLAPGPFAFPGQTMASFQPIFWNSSWFPEQTEHTMGMLVQDKHPVFDDFPTDGHADWQWWDPMLYGRPIDMAGLPQEIKPMIQPIDDWNQCRKLGLLMEMKVGRGRLILSSIDLINDMEGRPVARQLLKSIENYMASGLFEPETSVEAQVIERLVHLNSTTRLNPNITASSSGKQNAPAFLLDGRDDSFWASGFGSPPPDFPHDLKMTFDNLVEVNGIKLLPDLGSDVSLQVKDISVSVLNGTDAWIEMVRVCLDESKGWKEVPFGHSVKTKGIKVSCLSPQKEGVRRARFSQFLIMTTDD